jgi:hypothetical protein
MDLVYRDSGASLFVVLTGARNDCRLLGASCLRVKCWLKAAMTQVSCFPLGSSNVTAIGMGQSEGVGLEASVPTLEPATDRTTVIRQKVLQSALFQEK